MFLPCLGFSFLVTYYGQKSKELGLPANEWNYRMAKRDEMYHRMAKEVRKSMDK